MLLSIMWTILLLTTSFVSASASCDACFNNKCFSRIPVTDTFKVTGQMALDRNSNNFYYHVENSVMKDFTCILDLDNIILTLVPGRDFSFARAVDQSSKDLYLSTGTDVYKYNPGTNDVELLFNNKTVWHMQYKDKVYYSEFLTNGLYTYSNGMHESIAALSKHDIVDFIIDKNDDIYFLSDFSVYRLKKDANQANMFADEIYYLSTDKFGEAYFIQPETKGLHKLDYSNDKLTDVGGFSNGIPTSAVFDKVNNLIYYDVGIDKVFYMTPFTGNCSVKTTGSGKNMKRTISVYTDDL